MKDVRPQVYVISASVLYAATVIPAQAGIKFLNSSFPEADAVDSRLRGNDDWYGPPVARK